MEFTNKSDSNLMKAAGERFERYYMESCKALKLQIKTNTSQVIFTKYKKYNWRDYNKVKRFFLVSVMSVLMRKNART